eukprot:scaffold15741_cov168-Skeletonema_marinoi.AAC.1
MIRGWIVDGCGIVRLIGFGGGIDGGGGLRVEIVAPLLVALGEALKDDVIGGGSDDSLLLSGGEDAERRFKFGAESEDVVASENVGTVGKYISLPSLLCDDGPAVVSAVANGVYGVVGGAAGICGEVIFGEEMIVGGDDDDDGND